MRTYYACDGSAEYLESGSSTTPQWSKTYIYLGARLLSTLTPNGSGGQFVQYHHPDRLGTRLVTNAQDTTYFEQQTLPFGTALNESPPTGRGTGSTNKRFTTYDRSLNTGLDYAVNRHYDAQQGRFTQVDPIGMASTRLDSPQTLNLYAYCTNDPVNHTDPSGLGFFGFLKNVFKKIVHALKAAVVAFVVAFVGSGGDFKKARRAATRAFVSDFGFQTRIWRPAGTAPTFPTGTGSPGLHQIFQGTILAGLFPSPQSYLRWVNGFAGGSLLDQTTRAGRCPPTGEQLANNPIVKRALNEAIRRGIERRLEHGGWVFWNKVTGRFFTIIKEPTVDPLNVSGVADRWDRIYLTNPPTPPAGWSIIATFHTHLENVGSHSFDIAVNNSHRVPGLIITPNGKIEPYGDFKRGIWFKDLPNGCK